MVKQLHLVGKDVPKDLSGSKDFAVRSLNLSQISNKVRVKEVIVAANSFSMKSRYNVQALQASFCNSMQSLIFVLYGLLSIF